MENRNRELYEKAKFILEHSNKKFDLKDYNSLDKILEELNIYHIELEIQNEELRNAQNRLSELIEKYTNIFEYAPIGYVILSKDLDILEINSTALIFLGINRNEISNKKFNHFIQSDFQDKFYFHIKKLLDEKVKQTEYIQIKNNKEIIDIQIESILYPYNDDFQIRCAMTDITQLKKLERDIIEAKNQAEQASETKSLFLSNISHELLTPLNAITGFSSILQDQATNEDIKDFAKIIYNSGLQLTRLVNNILSFKNITSNIEKNIETNFNIVELIEELIEQFKDEIKAKNLILQKNVLPNFKTEIYSDKSKVQKIVYNLLSNAVKFTNKGKIEINLSTIKKYNKYYLNVEIVDTGIGIGEEKKSQLFQMFNQLDNSLKKKYGGIGLGLVLTKELVKSLNGYISFSSEKDVGSKFYVTIPYGDSKSFMDNYEDYQIEGINVILIEDNDISLKIDGNIIQAAVNSDIVKLKSIDNLEKYLKEKNIIFIESNMVTEENREYIKEIMKKENTYFINIFDIESNDKSNFELFRYSIKKPLNKNIILKSIIDYKIDINISRCYNYEYVDIEKIKLLNNDEVRKNIKYFSELVSEFNEKYDTIYNYNVETDKENRDKYRNKINDFLDLCNSFLKDEKIKGINEIIEKVLNEAFINENDRQFSLYTLNELVNRANNELLYILYKIEKK